jgi:hypothetical protein
MECIFLEEGQKCTAHQPQFAANGVKMDEETLKKYCRTEEFDTCPRYKAYMDYQGKHAH